MRDRGTEQNINSVRGSGGSSERARHVGLRGYTAVGQGEAPGETETAGEKAMGDFRRSFRSRMRCMIEVIKIRV